jgi:hypothetical protein
MCWPGWPGQRACPRQWQRAGAKAGALRSGHKRGSRTASLGGERWGARLSARRPSRTFGSLMGRAERSPSGQTKRKAAMSLRSSPPPLQPEGLYPPRTAPPAAAGADGWAQGPFDEAGGKGCGMFQKGQRSGGRRGPQQQHARHRHAWEGASHCLLARSVCGGSEAGRRSRAPHRRQRSAFQGAEATAHRLALLISCMRPSGSGGPRWGRSARSAPVSATTSAAPRPSTF